MATWTDMHNKVWTFDDDKLNFELWVKEDATRELDWDAAVSAFLANSTDTKVGVIFSQWTLYANATTPQ
jgi:hypothetical protein